MQKPLMYEDTENGYSYQPERYIRPTANLSVFVWLALLGLPALILFLIYSKVQERPAPPPAMHMEQPAHH
jgi:hypothetical protein